MTAANARKLLARHGTLTDDRGRLTIIIGRYVVGCLINGRDEPGATITCCHIRNVNDRPDSMTDYFPETYFKSLTAAIRAAHTWHSA